MCADSLGDRLLRYPITGRVVCCARGGQHSEQGQGKEDDDGKPDSAGLHEGLLTLVQGEQVRQCVSTSVARQETQQ
jgi:hypothetical protein